MKKLQVKTGVVHLLAIIIALAGLTGLVSYSIYARNNGPNVPFLHQWRASPCDSYGDWKGNGNGKITYDEYADSGFKRLYINQASQEKFADPKVKRGLKYADVNGSGLVDKEDQQLIKDYLLKNIDTFPVCSMDNPPEPRFNTGESVQGPSSQPGSTIPGTVGPTPPATDFAFYKLDGQTCHLWRVNLFLKWHNYYGYLWDSEISGLTFNFHGDMNAWLASAAKRETNKTIADALGADKVNELRKACQGQHPQTPVNLLTPQKRVNNVDRVHEPNETWDLVEGDTYHTGVGTKSYYRYIVHNGKLRLTSQSDAPNGLYLNPCGYGIDSSVPSEPGAELGQDLVYNPPPYLNSARSGGGLAFGTKLTFPVGANTKVGDCPYVHPKWNPPTNVAVPTYIMKRDHRPNTNVNCNTDKINLYLKQRVWGKQYWTRPLNFYQAEQLYTDLQGNISGSLIFPQGDTPAGREPKTNRNALDPVDWDSHSYITSLYDNPGKRNKDIVRRRGGDEAAWLTFACDGNTPYLSGNPTVPSSWYNYPGAPQ